MTPAIDHPEISGRANDHPKQKRRQMGAQDFPRKRQQLCQTNLASLSPSPVKITEVLCLEESDSEEAVEEPGLVLALSHSPETVSSDDQCDGLDKTCEEARAVSPPRGEEHCCADGNEHPGLEYDPEVLTTEALVARLRSLKESFKNTVVLEMPKVPQPRSGLAPSSKWGGEPLPLVNGFHEMMGPQPVCTLSPDEQLKSSVSSPATIGQSACSGGPMRVAGTVIKWLGICGWVRLFEPSILGLQLSELEEHNAEQDKNNLVIYISSSDLAPNVILTESVIVDFWLVKDGSRLSANDVRLCEKLDVTGFSRSTDKKVLDEVCKVVLSGSQEGEAYTFRPPTSKAVPEKPKKNQ